MFPQKTPYVSAEDSIKGAEAEPKRLPEALKMAKGDVRAFTDNSVPFLVKMVDRTAPEIPPFARIEDKVRAAYVRQKAELLAAGAAEAVLKKIKDPADFNSAAAANHLQVHDTGEFPRAERQVPGIGPFAEATEAAALAQKVPVVLDRVLENEGNSYIVQVIGRVLPTEQEWKTKGPTFTQQLLQQRRSVAWGNFINDLKMATPISVNSDFLGQATERSSM